MLMMVEILKDSHGKPYGVELIASSALDRQIIRRFWGHGVKVNTVTNGDEKLGLTFADLLGT
jgi:hypothetical protein